MTTTPVKPAPVSCFLKLEVKGHVALITIDHPPANTWNNESLIALRDMVDHLDGQQEVYALVISGAGEKFFSAGADLKIFAGGGKSVAEDTARLFGEAFERLARFRGVSIAAINGYAMGGGLECALACDLRIAEEQAQLALPEASVGLLPCGGGTQNLAWLVGEGWAKRMILCGERVSAATALRIGLIEERVPKGQAKAVALEWAQRVEKQSPLSVAACKRLIQGARSKPLLQVLPAERQEFAALFDSSEQREGVAAFLEKRPPVWRKA